MYVTTKNAKKMIRLLSAYQKVASVEEYVEMLTYCREIAEKYLYYDEDIYENFIAYYLWLSVIYGEPFKIWAKRVYGL